ncbi:hypothetical protein I302_101742 [Kwoniella bestiolae CBS 10118]|uniref:Uncharacterized protein n=1 Tax=Kwoniella bestiolae CBS 10118 TaxID=1296100 RepID=A0A1B9GD27_9TREE|nr:hypothetical protein I302_00419 [Kwoniella bestiolae CBS 10118]OCF28929.1 hypothetical protein I302_00419 [Kwoniella bestiolae CBS 10118]
MAETVSVQVTVNRSLIPQGWYLDTEGHLCPPSSPGREEFTNDRVPISQWTTITVAGMNINNISNSTHKEVTVSGGPTTEAAMRLTSEDSQKPRGYCVFKLLG